MRLFYSVSGGKAWPLCLWSWTSSRQHPLIVRTVWQNAHGFWSNVDNCVWLIEESGRSRSRVVGDALTVVVRAQGREGWADIRGGGWEGWVGEEAWL